MVLILDGNSEIRAIFILNVPQKNKNQNIFCTGCQKSPLGGGETYCFDFFPQQKV